MGLATTELFGGTLDIEVTREITIHKQAKHAPLYALLQGTSREQGTPVPEFKWKVQSLRNRADAVNNVGGYDDTATSIVVDDGSKFAKYDVVLVESTGEVMLVTAVAGNTLTVVRSVGTTAAAAMADNAVLRIIGNAHPEGDNPAGDRIDTTAEYDNYTQIFKAGVEITGTLEASNTVTEEERARRRKVAMDQILEEIEHAFFFGELGKRTEGGSPQRFMRGIFDFASVNVTDANGTLTEAEFNDWLADVFQYGSGTKVLFASHSVAAILTTIFGDKIRLATDSDVVGLKLNRMQTYAGEVVLVPHPNFVGAVFGNAMCAVDLDQIKLRPLKGNKDRSLHLREDIKKDGSDGMHDEWLGEMSLELGDPAAHGWMKNITVAG